MCISILGSYGFFDHIKHCFACTWVGCHLEFSILYPSRKSHISRKRLTNAFVSVYVHMHEKYCKTYFYNGQNYLFFMSVTAVATQQPSEFRDEVDKESKWLNKIYLLAEHWGFVFVIINHICTNKSIRSVRRAAQPQYRNTFLQRRLILTLHDGFLIKTRAHIKGSVHQEKYNGHRLLVDHTRTFRRMFMLFFPYSESEWGLGGQAPGMTKKHHKHENAWKPNSSETLGLIFKTLNDYFGSTSQ